MGVRCWLSGGLGGGEGIKHVGEIGSRYAVLRAGGLAALRQ